MIMISKIQDCWHIQGCMDELVQYWPMEVMCKVSLNVVFQVEWQVCEMRRLVVESGRGSGGMFTADRVILAAVSVTSLPQIFESVGL